MGRLIKAAFLNEDNQNILPARVKLNLIIFLHLQTAHFVTNKKLFYAVSAIVLIAASIVLTLKLHWADFHVYYTAGHSLLSGRTDLYAPDFADSRIMDYRYPVFFLLLFLPFCWLPYQAAEFVWLWLNIAIIYLTILAIRRGLKAIAIEPIRFRLIAALSFLMCAKYFVVSMRILNAHIIVLGMVFAAFYLLLKQRQAAAAVLMALAITFKVVPILTLPYFLIKKQWAFLALTVVFIVAFSLLPALYFGFDQNLSLLGDWYQHVMVNNQFHNTNGPINVALEGQLERYLSEIDYSQRIEDSNYQNINLLSLDKDLIGSITKLLSLTMMFVTVFVIWFCGKLRRQNDLLAAEQNGFSKLPSAFDSLAYHEFGLMVCLALLIEPRSNVYYFLALFFPLLPFLHSFLRNCSKFNLAALSFIVVATCGLPLLPGSWTQRLLLVLGVDFYIALALWIALGYNLVWESRRLHSDLKTDFTT